MQGEYFDVRVERSEAGAVVQLIGEVDLDTAPTVESCLEAVLADGEANIVIDLDEVTLLDSSGVTVLLHGYRAATAAGRSLRVASPRPSVQRVLEIAGVSQLLGL
jgi:anti-sigma B factor antagonist